MPLYGQFLMGQTGNSIQLFLIRTDKFYFSAFRRGLPYHAICSAVIEGLITLPVQNFRTFKISVTQFIIIGNLIRLSCLCQHLTFAVQDLHLIPGSRSAIQRYIQTFPIFGNVIAVFRDLLSGYFCPASIRFVCTLPPFHLNSFPVSDSGYLRMKTSICFDGI